MFHTTLISQGAYDNECQQLMSLSASGAEIRQAPAMSSSAIPRLIPWWSRNVLVVGLSSVSVVISGEFDGQRLAFFKTRFRMAHDWWYQWSVT